MFDGGYLTNFGEEKCREIMEKHGIKDFDAFVMPLSEVKILIDGNVDVKDLECILEIGKFLSKHRDAAF